jgi:hypothetical protein
MSLGRIRKHPRSKQILRADGTERMGTHNQDMLALVTNIRATGQS